MMRIRTLIVLAMFLPGAACAGANEPQSGEASVAAADRTVDCPALTQAKYPFLRCTTDATGQVVFAGGPDRIEGSRLPALDSFTESDDYWGN